MVKVYAVLTADVDQGSFGEARSKLIGVYTEYRTASDVADAYDAQAEIEENNARGYAHIDDVELDAVPQLKG